MCFVQHCFVTGEQDPNMMRSDTINIDTPTCAEYPSNARVIYRVCSIENTDGAGIAATGGIARGVMVQKQQTPTDLLCRIDNGFTRHCGWTRTPRSILDRPVEFTSRWGATRKR